MLHKTYTEAANLFIVTLMFEKAGDSMQDIEVHTYDHVHHVARGTLRVIVNGQETVYSEGSMILIAAGERHRFEALEDGTVGHCIHALRSQDGSGELLDPALVPHGSTAIALAAPITRPG
jgi:quercetin dioxygenase-like cupin family protein